MATWHPGDQGRAARSRRRHVNIRLRRKPARLVLAGRFSKRCIAPSSRGTAHVSSPLDCCVTAKALGPRDHSHVSPSKPADGRLVCRQHGDGLRACLRHHHCAAGTVRGDPRQSLAGQNGPPDRHLRQRRALLSICADFSFTGLKMAGPIRLGTLLRIVLGQQTSSPPASPPRSCSSSLELARKTLGSDRSCGSSASAGVGCKRAAFYLFF
jgi:hypothetical protein